MATKTQRRSKDNSDKKDRRFLITACLFIGLSLLFNLLVYLLSYAGQLEWLIEGTTSLSGYLVKAVGFNAALTRESILLGSRTLVVTLECTAVFIIALFSAFVISYPTDIKRKIQGLAVGIPGILLLNLLRLLVVALVSERYPRYFDYVHDYLWQIAFILAATVPWYLWASREREPLS
ncbi:MAG: archaeosortase/exosortase family protein [Candidatus Aquicultorales bacterium]